MPQTPSNRITKPEAQSHKVLHPMPWAPGIMNHHQAPETLNPKPSLQIEKCTQTTLSSTVSSNILNPKAFKA